MSNFRIDNRYKLELHWGKVTYIDNDVVKLSNSFFSGPVIVDVDEIRDADSINLDFSKQYSYFMDSYYIAILGWDGIDIRPDKILLDNVTLRNESIKTVPKLHNDDYLIMDTSNHESDIHYQNFNYRTYLVNRDGIFYNFRR